MHPIPISEDDLRRYYLDQQMPLVDIAKIYGCSAGAVRDHAEKCGILRSKSDAQRVRNRDGNKRNQGSPGESNPKYRHGAYIQERVYRKMLAKDKCTRCGSAENLLIHHKNGDHYDNHIENLEVLCSPCHSSYHKTEYWKKRKDQ